MSTERKNNLISSFVTSIIFSILLMLLYFCGLYFQVPPPQPKEMILIEFTSGGGGGGGAENKQSTQTPISETPDIATQIDQEAPVVPTNPKPTKTNTDKSTVSEPKQEPGAAYRPGKGSGSGGGSGTGSGTGAGMGTGSGDGAGDGSGRGIGYGSGNRAYVNIPDVNINENGNIYVEVHVTAQGNVINARIISNEKYPTTITNTKIQNDCLVRALSAKYIIGKEELRIIVFK